MYSRSYLSSYSVLRYFKRFTRISSASNTESTLKSQFIQAMRQVPSPVVVVTSSNGSLYRGVTCSSFTSVSLTPPIISFCINKLSRMHDLLLETKCFIVNILNEKQIHYSIHFSKPVSNGQSDQFEGLSYTLSHKGHPMLSKCSVTLECTSHSVHTIGDHHIWYGLVDKVSYDNTIDTPPLLYYDRSYHSVGDGTFMKLFETAALAYEDWTHEAHLRMAWNYIQEYGREKATPLIKQGIQNFNEKNSEKVQRGYHETITIFFIHMICHALDEAKNASFQEFLDSNPNLRDSRLLYQYYSYELINTNEAKQRWVEPDLRKLP